MTIMTIFTDNALIHQYASIIDFVNNLSFVWHQDSM